MQMVPALSSGEAEFNAGVKAIGNVLGVAAYAEDLGAKLECAAGFDSSAALGMLKRTGLGRARHVATPLLWVQAVVADGRCSVYKVKGTENVADLGTKDLTGPKVQEIMQELGYEFPKVQSNLALKAQC